LFLGLVLGAMALVPPDPPTPTPLPTKVSNPTPAPSPQATWKAIINAVDTGTECGDYVAEYGVMYLAVDVSLQNLSDQTQVLNDSLIDLSDNAGGHYHESKCAHPDNQFTVPAGESIEVMLVFLVPSSGSCFHLSIIDASHNINDSWGIGCKYS